MAMKETTKGACVIHHTKKLQEANNTQDFEEIELAGKCGVFLSNLAASEEQSELGANKIAAIAKVSNIKITEIETIKKKLEEAHLIETGKKSGSLSVLGITTASVLGHTADIFNSTDPSDFQLASLELSENISDLPKGERMLKQYISDTHKLSAQETTDLFSQSEVIGFVDYEKLDDTSKYYFKGNLFRKEYVNKANAILSSLSSEEARKIAEMDLYLSSKGCMTLEKSKLMLGEKLLAKLQAIGMYDFNDVSNPLETKTLVTKPSAFSKYGNPFEEDALDLAKAFVSSLFYGMNYSPSSRGKITMLPRLLRKLINGHAVGPTTAIGQDYKLLELKRVIQLIPSTGGMYYMRLLKKDIGEIALQVLEIGDASEQTVVNIYSGSVTQYIGPEQKRDITRKKQNEQSKKAVAELLRTFRN